MQRPRGQKCDFHVVKCNILTKAPHLEETHGMVCIVFSKLLT